MVRRYWSILAIIALLTPLGLLAEGTAWGEWAAEDLAGLLGFVPAGITHATSWWHSLFPDYTVKGLGEGRISHGAGYIIAAVLGSAAVYLLMQLYLKFVMRNGAKM